MAGWNLPGKEAISINKVNLIVTKYIFNLCRVKKFETFYILNFRLSPHFITYNGGVSAARFDGLSCLLTFDYRAKTYTLCNNIDEEEVKNILKVIIDQFNFLK